MKAEQQVVQVTEISPEPNDKYAGIDVIWTSLDSEMSTLIQRQLDSEDLSLTTFGEHGRVLVSNKGFKEGEVICTCPSAFYSFLLEVLQ